MNIRSKIAKWFPPPRPKIHDEACIEKAATELKAEHEKTRERIDRMKDDILRATLNGEERWFLSLHKEKGERRDDGIPA